MRSARVSVFQVLLVVLLPAFASAALYAQNITAVFPQFASGGGWSSDIFVRNRGIAAAIVAVSFFGDDGSALTVDSTLGVGSVFSLNLNAGNTQVVRVKASGEQRTGYIAVSFPSGAYIGGSEIFRLVQNGVIVTEFGVPLQFPFTTSTFSAEVDVSRGVYAAVAISNGAAAQRCAVTLLKNDGSIQSIATLELPQGGHLSKYLDSLFPGLDGFSGVVMVSAGSPIGVVALRQDQSVFGTVSVDNGPLLAPYYLNQSAVPEAEPNNTAAQANSVSFPTVVAGSVLSDPDLFKFSGKQGDVIAAQVSTAGLNSALDSLVYLVGTDGSTILSSNDDNGLFIQNNSFVQPQSDSFLQAVLPTDGTFYIGVTDALGQGGLNKFYRLHLQLVTPGGK